MWSLRKKTERGSFRSSGRKVEYRYSREADTLRLRWSDDAIAYSEDTDMGIVDFNDRDEPVGIEILAATDALPELERRAAASAASVPPKTVRKDMVDDLLKETMKSLARDVSSYANEARSRAGII